MSKFTEVSGAVFYAYVHPRDILIKACDVDESSNSQRVDFKTRSLEPVGYNVSYKDDDTQRFWLRADIAKEIHGSN